MLATLYVLLLMIGAIQGIVMGILLMRNKASPQWHGNRFLALMLFFFAYRLIVETLHGFGFGGVNQWSYHVLLEYNWIYGTLLFFYFKTLFNPKYKLTRKDAIHFLPVIIEFCFSNFIKTQNFFWDGTKESLSWAGYYGYLLWMHTPFQIIVAILCIIFYTHKSQKLFDHTQTNVRKFTFIAAQRIKWILRAYWFFSIISLIAVLVDYFFFDFAFNPVHQYPIFISMALVTYGLGVQGIWHRKEQIFEKKKKKVVNETVLKAIIQKVERYMKNEKPYLESDLDVSKLAKAMGVKSYLLTNAINHQLNKNFKDYVNGYRVNEVIERLNNEKYSHQTLLSIGYDAGFNSKASFNRVIKKMTGKSPSELRG